MDTDTEEEGREEGGLNESGLGTGMTMLMRAMQPETVEAGVMLMEQVVETTNETNLKTTTYFGVGTKLKR